MRTHRKKYRVGELTGNHAALALACARMGKRGQSALAEALNTPDKPCSQTTVWHWLYRSKHGAPAQRCAEIERLTGVPRWELRSDIDWLVVPERLLENEEAA